ncbi:RHS repeat domain-containing protein [Mucilaginibacter boryungensis]|uniref:YD repeat-containing protein n=1 Tax=Mucilaginibacter boryungensis TaxID=768480 RepID=A0ABR9XLT0_9SPHI|nr:hypothetical protein [Mucilaginibacter boryungensis]MBE9668236.1 hypothetical protein [Mucilaginibacter boryungensis]
MKKLYSLLICLLILSASLSYAQTSSDKSLIPPSPNTASLLKYAQIPVSKYTGLPNISIPLYTIQSGSLSLPVSLSYHASGIKASEEASWVGLGWSLNCGGVIGRSIRGKDDMVGSGFIGSPAVDSGYGNGYWAGTAGIGLPAAEQALTQVYGGTFDSEPDLFYFNFGGYSGKFYIPQQEHSNGMVYAVELDQKSDLKILLDYNQKRFTVTDGKGINYYFGTREYGFSESLPVTESAGSDIAQLTLTGNDCPDNKSINSWYLDSVAAPAGDKIIFHYTVPADCGGIASPTSLSETYYYRYINDPSVVQHVVDYYNLSRSVTQEVVLVGVTFKNGHVDFNISPRTDAAGFEGYTPSRLDSMSVYANNNVNPLRSVKFNYSYFSDRLKLDYLYVDNKPYHFNYNETMALPSKQTKSVDHWGLYNGAGNSKLVPKTYFDSEDILIDNGGNREADSARAQIGILTQIDYPTGGSVKFDYELNDFGGNPPIYAGAGGQIESNTGFYPSNPSVPFIQKDFYVPRETTVTFSGSAQQGLDCSQMPSSPGENEAFALLVAIPDSAATGYSSIEQYSPSEYIKALFYENCATASYKTYNIKVQPGWYRIIAESDYSHTVADVSLGYRNIIGSKPGGTSGGGLRVKRITATDANQHTMINKYIYRDIADATTSSGVLMTTPIYKDAFSIPLFSSWVGSLDGRSAYAGTFIEYRSSSVLPLSTAAQGGYIGYSYVTELFGENGEGGKKISSFMNGNYGSSYNAPPTEQISNGLLLTESTFKATGGILQKVENNYTDYGPAQKTFWGMTYQTPPFIFDLPRTEDFWGSGADIPPDGLAAVYYIKSYPVYCNWYRLINTTTSDYTPAGNHVNYISYDYNATNRQVSRSTVNQSDGSRITTKYKFPVDYSSSAGSIFSAMIAANQIESPVEVQKWREVGTTDSLLASTVTEYKYFAGNKFISPYKTYQLKTVLPLSNTTVGESSPATGPFNSLLFNNSYYDLKNELDYDNYGNPVKMIANGQQTKAYQWSYNNQYPIAECKNASNTEFYVQNYEETGGTAGSAHTGNKYTTNTSVSWTAPNSRAYVIDYWYLDGATWKYKQDSYTGSSYTMTGGSAYDDVRIYPRDAQITTYTYEPLVGMTSMTDTKGQTTYYEYDSFQRLINIRDQQGNIVKHTDYHYANQ